MLSPIRRARKSTDLTIPPADGQNQLVVGSQVRRAGVVLLLLLVSATARCGRGARPHPPDEPAPQAEWSLTVTNRHWLDVSIEVVYDGQRARVGTVPASHTETYLLRLPGQGGRTVRLEADAVGSRERTVAEGIPVRGGQHVSWTLESRLAQSSVQVR